MQFRNPMDALHYYVSGAIERGEKEAIVVIDVDPSKMSLNQLKAKARDIGKRNGLNAASWAFDGNTSTEWYQTALHGIMAGDPAIMDRFNEPSFSGEYAESYTEQDLARDIGIEFTYSDEMDELADSYLDAAREAFWDEVERVARLQLG